MRHVHRLAPLLLALVACSAAAQPPAPSHGKKIVAPSPVSQERRADLDSLAPYEAAARAVCSARLAKIEPSRRWILDSDREWGLTLRKATAEDTDETCERYMDDDGALSLCVMERGGDRAEKVWQTAARELKKADDEEKDRVEKAAERAAVRALLPKKDG